MQPDKQGGFLLCHWQTVPNRPLSCAYVNRLFGSNQGHTMMFFTGFATNAEKLSTEYLFMQIRQLKRPTQLRRRRCFITLYTLLIASALHSV